jgi:hypothetical protein
LAIASNQGGCDWVEISAINLKVGQRFQVMDSDEGENFFSGHVFTVEAVGASGPYLCIETGSQDFDFATNDRILVQYKTIESAIEECQFAADMCRIGDFAFCPTKDGMLMVVQSKLRANGWMPQKHYSFGDYFGVGNFRKPGSGMLDFFKRMFSTVMPGDQTIMIGDRPEDEAAALAAGFRFLDAEAWRNGASVEVVK